MNFAALSAFAEEFMALRSAVARRDPHRNNRDRISLKHREQLLRSFIAYWHEHGGQWPIRSSLLLDWVAVGSDRQHPSRDQRRFYVARSFLQQVRVLEPATEIPENVRPLSGLPRSDEAELSRAFPTGAVSIGTFEVSRWRLRRAR